MALFKSFLVNTYLICSNMILDLCRKLIFSKVKNPKVILIFRNGSMGDSLVAMPSIMVLKNKFKNSKFILLTNTGRKNLVSLANLIHEDIFEKVIDYQNMSFRTVALNLKKEKPNLIIQLPQSKAKFIHLIRDMLFFRYVGIKQGFGWQKYHVPFLLSFQDDNRKILSERDRLLFLLKDNIPNIRVDQYKYPFNIKVNDYKVIDEIIDNKLNGKDKFICMVIGAKRKQNRWPISYFQEIITRTISNLNHSVVLLGGPEDRILSDDLVEYDKCINLIGDLSPVQSGIFMSKSKLVVTNDTGPMHLSYAMNVPTIALFSSRDFKNLWFPPMPGNIIFRTNEVRCKLCLSENCQDNICMKAILPDNVFKSIQYIIGKT